MATFRTSRHGHRASPRALYVVQMAGNDYFYYEDYGLTMPGTVENVGRQVVANECEAVRQLAQLGAKRFLVISSEDVALLPWEVGAGRTDAASAYTQTVNGELPGAMRNLKHQLDIEIAYFDLAKAGVAIRSSASRYGLTELNAPFEKTYPDYVAGTGDPDKYFFWDEWHPTRAVHTILGGMMFSGLPGAWKLGDARQRRRRATPARQRLDHSQRPSHASGQHDQEAAADFAALVTGQGS